MKRPSNITFVIFTQNEEKRIEYPIRCFLPYGNVLISDDHSTDNTVKIARKLGAEVINRKTYEKHLQVENEEEANYIFKHVKTDWVFWGFADTMVPKTCLELYVKTANENKYKVVVQKLKTLLYDNREYFSSINVTTRFFRKDSMDFKNNPIHQTGKYKNHVKPTDILYLPPIDEYSIYHFSTDTTPSILSKINLYTSIQASSSSAKFLGVKIILLPLLYFLNTYILSGGFKNGVQGFIVAVQYSFFYPILVYSKVYENEHNLTPELIEKKFSHTKRGLLVESPKSNIIKKIIASAKNALVSRMHIFYKFR